MRPKFSEAVGAALAGVAVGAVAYLAIVAHDQQAAGALMAITAAASGFFLRGRTQAPTP